jgi:hypothetical protein
VIGHLPTIAGAIVLCTIAYALGGIPRFGRRRWIPPAWGLAVCVIVLIWLFEIYAIELYAVFRLFRDREFATSPYLDASPRARHALLLAMALATVCAAIALDLARSHFGSNCSRCLHDLLASQTDCPECGTPRVTGPMPGASRLDALAVRKPPLALLLEAASLALVTSGFMATAIAFVPTMRAQADRDIRQLHGFDASPLLGEATIGIEANHVAAPMLPFVDWRRDRVIRVRITAERASENPALPRTDFTTPRSKLTRHYIDVDIEEEIRGVDDYTRLCERMDNELLPTTDRTRLQARIELLLVKFLGLAQSQVPKTFPHEPPRPDPTPAQSAAQLAGVPQYGFRAPPQARIDRWPPQYLSDWDVTSRDSPVAALVIPCVIGGLATAVFLWPRARAERSSSDSTDHARRARTRSHS